MLLAATPESQTDKSEAMSIRMRRLARQKALTATLKALAWVAVGLIALGLGVVSYQYPDITGSGFFWEALFGVIALASFRSSYRLVKDIRAGRT